MCSRMIHGVEHREVITATRPLEALRKIIDAAASEEEKAVMTDDVSRTSLYTPM